MRRRSQNEVGCRLVGENGEVAASDLDKPGVPVVAISDAVVVSSEFLQDERVSSGRIDAGDDLDIVVKAGRGTIHPGALVPLQIVVEIL